MARIKRGTNNRKRHKKVLKQAKGYYGSKHTLFKTANQASKFLSNENRVKVSVRFRGRELGHKDLGKEVLDKFYELTKDVGQIEKKPSMEGRMMIMFMGPLTDKDN